MTTLLDIPPELLAQLACGHTHILHDGGKYESDQWKEDRTTIARLARSCRVLHGVFNPLLYRTLILTSLSVGSRLNLIRTVTYQPILASYVENLRLDLFAQRFPLRDSRPPNLENITADQLDASDGDWYRLLGHLFFPNTHNLKKLTVRCTRYDKIPCQFDELVIAHIQCYCQGRGIGIGYAAVEQLLMAPSLQNLTLSGPYISDAKNLEKLPSAGSNITNLALRLVMLSADTLRAILNAPCNLTYLDFYSASMRAPFLETGKRDQFLTFREIEAALQPQKDNLGTVKICLPSVDSELPSEIFGGLSFNNFRRLTKLSISPEMFLGWKECKHRDPNVDLKLGPTEPIEFANCLPDCLEELTIYLQQYQRVRNETNYAYNVVRGVLLQRNRLYKLRHIELACCKGVISCLRCRTAAMTVIDQSPTVRKSEIAQITDMCANANMSFHWNEEVWGIVD